MECKDCIFSAQRTRKPDQYICNNPDCPYFIQRVNIYSCKYGVAKDTKDVQEVSTSVFTEVEPKIELYSVVCKIDTGVDYIHREYLVNTTSQKRALELVTEYFKNTSHSDEAIVGEPTVHVLRKEGIIDSHQVGCY